MENDLFTKKNYDEVMNRFSTSKKEKIIYDYIFKFKDYVFDLEDMIETLSEIKSGGAYIPYGEKLGKFFKEIGVLESTGSRDMSAIEGPNFEEFLNFIKMELSELRK